MGAEVLLYGYGLVCLSMIGFNLFYSMHLRSNDYRLEVRTEAFRCRVMEEMRSLKKETSGSPKVVQTSPCSAASIPTAGEGWTALLIAEGGSKNATALCLLICKGCPTDDLLREDSEL